MLTMAGAFQATAGAVGCYVVAMLASKRLRSWTFAVLWTECLEGLLDRATRAHKRRFFSSLHLQGRILDIGSGSGNQLQYLVEGCPDVTEIVCVEPNQFMLAKLRAAAARCEETRAAAKGKALRIQTFNGTAEEYFEATDAAMGGTAPFDACLFYLVLCSVGDPVALTAFLHNRALRPGGRLVFHEHVAPKSSLHLGVFAVMQPLWGLFGDGCQLSRNTASLVKSAAPWSEFSVLRRFGSVIPHAVGEAVK